MEKQLHMPVSFTHALLPPMACLSDQWPLLLH
jgi:hypothetical protein